MDCVFAVTGVPSVTRDLSATRRFLPFIVCVSMSFKTQRSESEFRLNFVFVVVSRKITGTRVSSIAPRHVGPGVAFKRRRFTRIITKLGKSASARWNPLAASNYVNRDRVVN